MFKVNVPTDCRARVVEALRAKDSDSGVGTRGTVEVQGIEQFTKLGKDVFESFFTDKEFRSQLAKLDTQYLTVVTNDPEIPWEFATPGGASEALSIRFSVSTSLVNTGDWVTEKAAARGESVRILFVVPEPDPLSTRTTDIQQSTTTEIKQIQNQLQTWGLDATDIVVLSGPDATRREMQNRLEKAHKEGRPFNILHFAGHTVFDPENDSRRGLVMTDNVMTPAYVNTELAGICPEIVFLNSCVTARQPTSDDDWTVSLFRAFVRCGVKAFVGTRWGPTSTQATRFAVKFYEKLLEHNSVGLALKEAKKAFLDDDDDTWASYVLYGHPLFSLSGAVRTLNPYKELLRYELGDANTYIGRDEERTDVLKLIEIHALSVLYGESGAGKSSFLRAAIADSLRKRDWLVPVVDLSAADPVPDTIRQLAEQCSIQRPTTDDLKTFLESSTKLRHRKILLILDQVERRLLAEDFVGQADPILKYLFGCLSATQTDIRLLFSIRQDRLSLFIDLVNNERIRDFGSFRLDYLTRQDANRNLAEPLLSHLGVRPMPDFLERVLDDIQETRSVQQRGRFYPPFVQLVGTRLFNKAREKRRAGANALNLSDYEVIDTSSLLEDHLKRTLDKRLGSRKGLGLTILNELAGSASTQLPAEQLVRTLSERFNIADIEFVLEQLTEGRLVSRVEEGVNQCLRLVHDCLSDILSKQMDDRERLRSVLRDGLRRSLIFARDKNMHPDWFVDIVNLNQIGDHLSDLTLSADEIDFLARSAIRLERYDLVASLGSLKDSDVVFAAIHSLWTDEQPEVVRIKRQALTAVKYFSNEKVAQFLSEVILNTESKAAHMREAVSSLVSMDGSGTATSRIYIASLLEKLKHQSPNREHLLRIFACLKAYALPSQRPPVDKAVASYGLDLKSAISLRYHTLALRVRHLYERATSRPQRVVSYLLWGATAGAFLGLLSSLFAVLLASSFVRPFLALPAFGIFLVGTLVGFIAGPVIYAIHAMLDNLRNFKFSRLDSIKAGLLYSLPCSLIVLAVCVSTISGRFENVKKLIRELGAPESSLNLSIWGYSGFEIAFSTGLAYVGITLCVGASYALCAPISPIDQPAGFWKQLLATLLVPTALFGGFVWLFSPRVWSRLPWSHDYLQIYHWPWDAIGDGARFWSWTVAMLLLNSWLRNREHHEAVKNR